MQSRRYVAALCFATLTGLFFAAACSDSGDDGSTSSANVEHGDAADDAADVTVTPVDSGPHYASNDSGSLDSGGGDDTFDPDAGTCLDTDPIDQTTYRYVTAAPILKNFCTELEVDTLVGYYEANAGLSTFSLFAWEKTVSKSCAACVFINDGQRDSTVWRPIVYVGDAIDTIDVGGCVEHLSGSEDCGRTFQQYEDCQSAACAQNCTTQEDYAACRADPALFTTACTAATDAVNAACGKANINPYEAACNYGVQFEGPIRVACMGTASDGGAPDAGDAGANDAGDSGLDAGPDASH